MDEAAMKAAWQHTSTLLCLQYNCNLDPKQGKPKSPDDFNPFTPKLKPIKVPLNQIERMMGGPPD